MGRLYQKQPGGTYYADYQIEAGGHWRRVQRCTKTRDLHAAKLRLRQWERTSASPDHRAPDEATHTVDQALAYLVENAGVRSEHYEYKGGHVARLLGSILLVDLTLDDLKGYVKDRQREGASLHSVVKECRALGRAMRMVRREKGWRTAAVEDVMPKFSGFYKPRKMWLTPEQFTALTDHFTARSFKPCPHWTRWVWVTVYTAGRRGTEAERLEWSDIDWERGTVHLRGTKTERADRVVPLAEPLRRFLEPLRQPKGRVVRVWHQALRDLALACSKLGIPRVTPNDLRRTYGSWLRQAGVPDAQIAALLGHADTRMVELVYGQHSDESLTAAVARLPDPQAPKKHKRQRRRPPIRRRSRVTNG